MFARQSAVRMSFANPNALPLARHHLVNSFKSSTSLPSPSHSRDASSTTTFIPAPVQVVPAKPAPAPVTDRYLDPASSSSSVGGDWSPTCIMFDADARQQLPSPSPPTSYTINQSPSPSPAAATNPAAAPDNASTVNPARTVVVTGASGGIGFETVKGLLSSLPFVELIILAVRDVARTRDAVSSLPTNTRGDSVAVEIVAVDLSNSDSVVACIEAVYDLIGNRALDLLVCNAGVMAPPLQYSKATITVSSPPPPSADHDKEAGEGSNSGRLQQQQQQATSATSITTAIEQQYFVNFIAHALLTDRLLPLLRHSPNARVVFVSSLAVAMAQTRRSPPCVAEKTGNTVTSANYSRWGCYADSKLAMSLFAKAMSQREPRSIEFVSLHPGIVQTDLARYILPKWLQFPIPDPVAALFGLLSPEQGARLSLDLAKAMPDTLESGAMYTGLGRKKAGRSVIPLLDNQQAVDELYNDTKAFIDSI